jgi:hypothetical protein
VRALSEAVSGARALPVTLSAGRSAGVTASVRMTMRPMAKAPATGSTANARAVPMPCEARPTAKPRALARRSAEKQGGRKSRGSSPCLSRRRGGAVNADGETCAEGFSAQFEGKVAALKRGRALNAPGVLSRVSPGKGFRTSSILARCSRRTPRANSNRRSCPCWPRHRGSRASAEARRSGRRC